MSDIKLTDDELLLLDGRVSVEAQVFVDAAKRRKSISETAGALLPGQIEMIDKIVTEAKANGRLQYMGVNVRWCDACKRSDGYWPYSRTTRYHRKGEPDYKRPKTLRAIDFARRFVTIQGHATVGCCEACVAAIRPTLLTMLADVRAELPEGLTGAPPRFKRHDNRKCKKCGWTGHEGEMGMLPAIMGGRYPGACPKCPARNQLFSTEIDSADGFTLVEMSPVTPDAES